MTAKDAKDAKDLHPRLFCLGTSAVAPILSKPRMQPFASFASFAVIAVAVGCLAACGPGKEVEPNDDFTQATVIKPGKVSGTIANPKDVDVYRLDLKQDAVLSAHVGGIRSVDFVLSIFDKDHVELKRADETAQGGDEELLDIGVHAGSYYISVSNKNPAADNPTERYVLDVRLQKAVSHELEPNETAQQASPLELPGVTRGHYWPSRNLLAGDTAYTEQDWFRVDVATGLFLLDFDLSDVPKVDPVVEIYDTNGYKIKEVDSGGAGEGESFKDFGVRGPVTYFIRLYAKNGAGNPDVPYEILTELIPYQGKTEFEPNDQRTDATPFENDTISGTIAPEGDADWYKVSIKDEGKQILRASVTGVDGLDLVLTVTDALGNPLLSVDNMGKGQPEVLTGLGVTKGDYYLVVSEKSGRAADARDSYTLTKAVIPYQEGLEYELNDTTSTAQPLKVGGGVDGYIGWKGDADVYQFNVYQKGTVVVEIAGVLNVRFQAALFDQDGNSLQQWSADKQGDSMTFQKDLDAGTYFLKLSGSEPSENNVRDKYTVRVKVR